LNDTAKELSIPLGALVPGYAKLASAAKAQNIEFEETQRIVKGLATASAAYQLSQEELSGTTKAFTDILSKGKLQAEEIRGQLGDRIPTAFSAAAKSMGLTLDELSAALDNGLVGGKEAVSAITNEFEKLAPVAQKNTQTTQAALNDLNTEFTLLSESVGPQILPIATDALKGFAGLLSFAAENAGTLTPALAFLALGVAAYTAQVKGATLATGLYALAQAKATKTSATLTAEQKKATAGFISQTKSLAAGALQAGAYALAIGLVVKSFEALTAKSDQSRAAIDRLREAQAKLKAGEEDPKPTDPNEEIGLRKKVLESGTAGGVARRFIPVVGQFQAAEDLKNFNRLRDSEKQFRKLKEEAEAVIRETDAALANGSALSQKQVKDLATTTENYKAAVSGLSVDSKEIAVGTELLTRDLNRQTESLRELEPEVTSNVKALLDKKKAEKEAKDATKGGTEANKEAEEAARKLAEARQKALADQTKATEKLTRAQSMLRAEMQLADTEEQIGQAIDARDLNPRIMAEIQFEFNQGQLDRQIDLIDDEIAQLEERGAEIKLAFDTETDQETRDAAQGQMDAIQDRILGLAQERAGAELQAEQDLTARIQQVRAEQLADFQQEQTEKMGAIQRSSAETERAAERELKAGEKIVKSLEMQRKAIESRNQLSGALREFRDSSLNARLQELQELQGLVNRLKSEGFDDSSIKSLKAARFGTTGDERKAINKQLKDTRLLRDEVRSQIRELGKLGSDDTEKDLRVKNLSVEQSLLLKQQKIEDEIARAKKESLMAEFEQAKTLLEFDLKRADAQAGQVIQQQKLVALQATLQKLQADGEVGRIQGEISQLDPTDDPLKARQLQEQLRNAQAQSDAANDIVGQTGQGIRDAQLDRESLRDLAKEALAAQGIAQKTQADEFNADDDRREREQRLDLAGSGIDPNKFSSKLDTQIKLETMSAAAINKLESSAKNDALTTNKSLEKVGEQIVEAINSGQVTIELTDAAADKVKVKAIKPKVLSDI